jgi:hypothetical protein
LALSAAGRPVDDFSLQGDTEAPEAEESRTALPFSADQEKNIPPPAPPARSQPLFTTAEPMQQSAAD